MNRKHWKIGAWVLFAGYCFALLWLLFFDRIGDGPGMWHVNLRPFETLCHYWRVLRHSTSSSLRFNARVNLLGNVALCGPLGIFLPMLFSDLRKFWRFLLLMVALIIALELTQTATGLGVADVDDLILNLLGACCGYLFWKLLPK